MATTALTQPPASEDLIETLLEFPDNRLLIDLCGEFDRNLAQIEQALEVQVLRRGNELAIHGDESSRTRTGATLKALYSRLESGRSIDEGDIDAVIRFGSSVDGTGSRDGDQLEMFRGGSVVIKTRKKSVIPRTKTQAEYTAQLFDKQLVFGLGPAGTGKTYLAVAVAVAMFAEGHVDRIVFSRPAVEAGERLGFLPGDMKDKVDPYMQPLYDALNDFLPTKQLARLIEEKRIEIAPLAFMRGRTLSNAFVVLDEAQNATTMQIKMFLTRLGQGSRMVVTGDMSQVDLPRGTLSGLIEAERILRNVDDIGFAHFTAKDVVRHPLVAKIIDAYDGMGKKDA